MTDEVRPTRNDILTQAHAQRVAEVEAYQINIDNFELALQMGEGREFFEEHQKQMLTERLHAEKVQQAMAQLMLDVLAKQIEAA